MHLPSEKAIEAMIEKMADFARQDLPKVNLVEADFEFLLSFALKESDLAFLFLIFRIIENIFDVFYSHLLGKKNPKIAKNLISPIGPLGSFSSKLSLALCLGYVSNGSFEAISKLRGIRNKFAHKASIINFASEGIKGELADFVGQNYEPVGRALAAAAEAEKELNRKCVVRNLDEVQKFKLVSIFLLSSTLREIFLLPVSIAHRVARKLHSRQP